ncbi:TadE/TadG family type IV pilus assembly protein [Paenibacillus sp. KN14-4R]|uniref:TadE/TadG family type IV pilus assembly protein n=1 Tax=Paenibacillus sp. KN14-4R TaxID=3445773 RepID=UPI003FA18396
MNKIRGLLHKQTGGITLEAAVVMPVFITFILALITMVRMASVDMALQSAAAESTKIVATHMYPVELLVNEAKERFGNTKLSASIDKIIERASNVKGKLEKAEEFVDDYAAYIPEPIVKLMEWEKKTKDAAIDNAGEAYDNVIENVLKPELYKIMTPVVWQFADSKVLKENRMEVKGVDWPSLSDRNKAFLGIELEYRFPLQLPFFKRDIILRKKAYERIWLGA